LRPSKRPVEAWEGRNFKCQDAPGGKLDSLLKEQAEKKGNSVLFSRDSKGGNPQGGTRKKKCGRQNMETPLLGKGAGRDHGQSQKASLRWESKLREKAGQSGSFFLNVTLAEKRVLSGEERQKRGASRGP